MRTKKASEAEAGVDGYSEAETTAISRFLLDAGVLSADDNMTMIAEIRAFLRRRLSR